MALTFNRSLRKLALTGTQITLIGWIGLEILPASAFEFRSIDGSHNNLSNPGWGEAHTPLIRLTPPAYDDGISSPRTLDSNGNSLPSPRAISNAVAAQSEPMPNSQNLTNWFWQWGQFVDHDLDLTEPHKPSESFNIAVPQGDPFFDPFNTGTQEISLNRSIYDTSTGTGPGNPRQQLNEITAYIDGSVIYGSDPVRASQLRANDGTGKLKTSAGNLLMLNTPGLPNAGGTSSSLFLSGDPRANEQIGLTSVHTLFLREHNRLADDILTALNNGDSALTQKLDDSGLSQGDFVYEVTRKVVGAQIQSITYNEFLPLLLGDNALRNYRGYDETVNSGISNEFSTAAYRFGHTMLTSNLLAIDPNDETISAIALRDSFFNPDYIKNNGIDSIVLGLADQQANEIDPFVVNDVRNFLFGPPGSGGFDLASLNLQRGRDHGLGSYNEIRSALGLGVASSFADITSDVGIQNKLASVYQSVNDVDVWIGGLAEDSFRDSIVGELFYTILKDQFLRLRDGDRFFYLQELEHLSLLQPIVGNIDRTTLADIILRNTSIVDLQDNVFLTSDDGLDTSAVPEPLTVGGSLIAALMGWGFKRQVKRTHKHNISRTHEIN